MPFWPATGGSVRYNDELGYVIKEEPLFGPVDLPFYDEGEEEEDLQNALSLREEEMEKLIQKEKQRKLRYNPLSLSKAKRYKFLFVNLLSLLVSESARGMTVATLVLYVLSYGADESFYAIVVSAFSVGRILGGFLLGWVFNKRGAKAALALSIVISLIGNVLYSVGVDKWVVLSSRVIVGVGTGVLTIVRACIAASTTKEERSRFISLSAAAAFIGFAVTPGVSFLLTKVEFSVHGFAINQFNSAGWILVVANLLVLILVIVEPVNVKPVPLEPSAVKESRPMKLYVVIWSYVFLNFSARGAISLIETVGAPMFLQIWEGPHYSDTKPSSLMFLIVGTVGLFIFLIIPYIKKVPENILTGIGFLFITAGSLVLIQFSSKPVDLTQFLVGMGLLWSIGSPITQVVIITAFSKALGARPQGVWMGLMQAGGSVGRIVFPLFASIVDYNIDFVICGGVAFISAILAIVLRWVKIPQS